MSVKIGLAVGKVSIIYVGGEKGRSEYLPVGKPLSEAFEAEHFAESGGVIIIPNRFKQLLGDGFEYQKIDKPESLGSPNGPFYIVKS